MTSEQGKSYNYIAMYLSEFVDERQYDRYIKAFKREGVPVLWENKDRHLMVIPSNKKSVAVLNNLTNENS
jgi:predicted HNH restriction endonuclease